MDADALVRDYLGRLEAAARGLPGDRRVELVGEVREHIATAQAEAGLRDELTVRNILERLGPPEEIVAVEGEPDAAPPAWAATPPSGPSVARGPWGVVEVAALLLLTGGAVLRTVHHSAPRPRGRVALGPVDRAAEAGRDGRRPGVPRAASPLPALRTGRDVRRCRVPVDPTRRDRCRDLPGGAARASPPVGRLEARGVTCGSSRGPARVSSSVRDPD